MSAGEPSTVLQSVAMLRRFAVAPFDRSLLNRKSLGLLIGFILSVTAVSFLGWPLLFRLALWSGLPAPRPAALAALALILFSSACGGWRLLRASLSREYHALALAAVNEELVTTIREFRRLDRELKLAASFPDQSPHPVLRLSAGGAILYANQSGRPILEEWSRKVGGQAPERWAGLVQEALAQGERELEVQVGVREYSVLLWPLPELEHVNLYWFDVTGRKKVESQLELIGSVFETTHEGIAITDPRGTIQRVNPAFEEITGYRSEEVVGRPLGVVDPARDSPEALAEFWAEMESKDRWQGETWNRRKDGEAYPEWQTVSLIRDGQGAPAHLVSVFSDITPIIQKPGGDPSAGLPRRPNRAAQSPPLRRQTGGGPQAGPPQIRPAGPSLPGPGQFQGDQRFPGPRHGRPGSPEGSPPPGGGFQGGGHRGPAGRGRVHHSAQRARRGRGRL